MNWTEERAGHSAQGLQTRLADDEGGEPRRPSVAAKTQPETWKRVTLDSREKSRWLFLCLFIGLLKLLLLALDPLPKMFMGDSACYLATAMVGWIPDDRSYFYGFLIRFVALSAESLKPLLLLQTLMSGLTALLLAYTCRSVFRLSFRTACILGLLCAVDPFQLVWERYS